MPGPLVAAGAVLLSVGAVMGIRPAGDIINRSLYYFFPTRLPEPPELVDMSHRQVIDEAKFDSSMRQQGFSVDWINNLKLSTFELIPIMELVRLRKKEKITEAEYIAYRDKLKIDPLDIQMYEDLFEYFPPASDLIRFAVRDVYSPEIVQAFGTKEDLPELFINEAAKAGIPREHAENYWAAHWALPSILQGYDMLHRGVITDVQLDILLKALDVMPFWRDKLKQISYKVLTRVDVRRMFRLGVLGDAEVLKSYKNLGYNDEDANSMLAFTKKFEADENTGLTRAAIVSAYKKGAINKEELITHLSSIGLSTGVATFWVSYATYERNVITTDDQIDTYIELYVNGVTDLGTLQEQLTGMNIPATYMSLLLSRARAKRDRNVKLPTKADLLKWLTMGIISEPEFNLKMLKLGYRPSDINNYKLATAGG